MALKEFERLFEIVKKLRDPIVGCPWDLAQTHKTLLKYLIEESYEFIDATQANSPEQMEEEIGDVLLQVLLHSIIAEQNKNFNIESVSKKLADKLIRRHPHVFTNLSKSKISVEEIKSNWEKTKKAEGKTDPFYINKKDNLAPALHSANKIGEKTNRVNFDWDDYEQVVYKVEEEWQELKEELVHSKQDKKRVEEELGDLFFTLAQLARHLELNPEEVLHKANNKFIKRFNKLETQVKNSGQKITDIERKKLEEYWNEAKK